jgi:hypothetical protein
MIFHMDEKHPQNHEVQGEIAFEVDISSFPRGAREILESL